MNPPVAWMDEWPTAYPCRRGPWTVTDETRWAIVDPDAGRELGAVAVRPVVVNPADDPVLVGLAAALDGGDLVSYRHHRRAVVRTDTGYVKVTAPKKTEAVAQRHRLAAELGIAGPSVRRCHADGRIELDSVSGRSLYELTVSGRSLYELTVSGRSLYELTVSAALSSAPSTEAPGRAIAAAVAEAMAGLHRHQPTDLPAHDPSPSWIETTARAAPELALELERIYDRLPPMPIGGSHLIHGDLHDKNVLLEPEVASSDIRANGSRPWTGALIDLDGLALGDPAIDVGNLTAHIRLRAVQGHASPDEAENLRRELLAHYGGIHALELDAVRIVERHTWLRLAALYYFRTSSQRVVPMLLSLAANE